MKRDSIDLLAIALVCAIFVVCSLFLDKFKSTAISVALLVFYALIAVNWYNRRRGWFWLLIVALAVVHVAAIAMLDVLVPEGPALAYIVPAAFIDGFAMYGLVNWLEMRMSRCK